MIVNSDILEWAASYNGPLFHALLCDPPYHLTEITRRFGKETSAPAQYGTDGAFQRASKGFMGKTWDGGDIAYRPETWSALARLLYPGAFGMAFASSRGWHRMAVAIEDAGLIIHPAIFCWTFGSGFPKATRIDTQVDRAAGAERPVVGQKKHQPKFAAAELGYREKDNGFNSKDRESFDITAPATELAAAWEGHRYGLQMIKPAAEPIIIFQKPYHGKPINNIVETGAGALNIDGARTPGIVPQVTQGAQDQIYGNGRGLRSVSTQSRPHANGRWPANFTLIHHPSCNGDCVEDCPARRLGEQSIQGVKDSGTASRYFHQSDWWLDVAEAIDSADPVYYAAKASKTERDAGLRTFHSKTVDDGRQTPIDNPYLRGETQRKNTHPTIKPLSLTRWLASLLLPPEPYAPRRLLVPFSGAGSEVIGAMLAGWEDVIGIEGEAEYTAIAKARISYWKQHTAKQSSIFDVLSGEDHERA